MPFDPISWALGFGATKATKNLLEHLFNSDFLKKLSKVGDSWSESLPKEMYTPSEVIFGINDFGPARELLQKCLIFDNQVPNKALWFNALFEAWESRKKEHGKEGNGFLQLSAEAASIHLDELAAELTLTCKKQQELFQISALSHLEEITSKTDTIEKNVEITMSAVLNHLDSTPFQPQLINQKAISQLLENPSVCNGQGLMELNSLLLIDEPSTIVSGKIRKSISWVGYPKTSLDMASYVPPKPENLPKMFAKFVDTWSSNKTQLHSDDTKEVIVAMANFHHELVAIHPFEDGNGRVARVLTDYQAAHLLFHEKPFKLRSDEQYFEALKKSDNGDLSSLVNLFQEKFEE